MRDLTKMTGPFIQDPKAFRPHIVPHPDDILKTPFKIPKEPILRRTTITKKGTISHKRSHSAGSDITPKPKLSNVETRATRPHNFPMLGSYIQNPRPFHTTAEVWEDYIHKQKLLSKTDMTEQEIVYQEVFYMENIMNDNNLKLKSQQFELLQVTRLMDYYLEFYQDKCTLKNAFDAWGYQKQYLNQMYDKRSDKDARFTLEEYSEVLRQRLVIFEKQMLLARQFKAKEISAKTYDAGVDDICKNVKRHIDILTEYENKDISIYLEVKRKVEGLLSNIQTACNGRPYIPWPEGYTPPADY